MVHDHARLSSAQLDRLLETIAQSARKLDNIVDELLLLATVRDVDVESAPLDMAALVAGALCRLEGLVTSYDAEIKYPDTWPLALGYGPWVEEVWVNYISNAIKYGGRPPRVWLGASRDKQKENVVRFWVRDNGPGLCQEEQARLFTPFTRLAQVRAEGHGLGLSIVRRIVDRLGGQVGVESVKGRGSLFWFTLGRRRVGSTNPG